MLLSFFLFVDFLFLNLNFLLLNFRLLFQIFPDYPINAQRRLSVVAGCWTRRRRLYRATLFARLWFVVWRSVFPRSLLLKRTRGMRTLLHPGIQIFGAQNLLGTWTSRPSNCFLRDALTSMAALGALVRHLWHLFARIDVRSFDSIFLVDLGLRKWAIPNLSLNLKWLIEHFLVQSLLGLRLFIGSTSTSFLWRQPFIIECELKACSMQSVPILNGILDELFPIKIIYGALRVGMLHQSFFPARSTRIRYINILCSAMIIDWQSADGWNRPVQIGYVRTDWVLMSHRVLLRLCYLCKTFPQLLLSFRCRLVFALARIVVAPSADQ